MNATLPISLQQVSITPEATVVGGAPAPFLHVAIFLPASAGAPGGILGDETFRLVSFDGQESASALFEFQLELHANTDTSLTPPYLGSTVPPLPADVQLSIDDLIGLSVTVGVNCSCNLDASEISQYFAAAVRGAPPPAGSAALDVATDQVLAYFNGIITAISMGDQGVYYVTMGPALAQLQHINAYTIYTNSSVIDTIARVMQASDGFPVPIRMQSTVRTDGSSVATSRVQDWLQGGESHYDFIERLVKKANLCFYFQHTATDHTVVFADISNLYYPAVNTPITAFRYTLTDMSEDDLDQEDVITGYRYQRALSSSSISSSFTRQYANFEDDSPTVPPFYLASADTAPAQTVALPLSLYKNYDFGDVADEVSSYTNAANAALVAASVEFSGNAFCPQFRVGHQFRLADIASQNAGPLAPANPTLFRPSFAGNSFVLTQIKHQARADGKYQNNFSSTIVNGLIGGFSIEQAQQETLLAVVVDTPANWQSFTPDYFHPETASFTANAGAMLYQPSGVNVVFAADPSGTPFFVKLSASMQTLPEAGAIVVVSRAQNESELPEIQNIISASGSKCATPSGWEASSRVGNNYSTSFGDNQSYSFGKNSVITAAGSDGNATSVYNTAVGIVSRQYGTGFFGNASYAQGASYNYSVAEGLAGATTLNASQQETQLDDIGATTGGGPDAAVQLTPTPPVPGVVGLSPIPTTASLTPPALDDAMNSALSTADVSTPDLSVTTVVPMVANNLLLNVSESYGSSYTQSWANVTSSVDNVGTTFNQSTIGTSVAWNTINNGSSAVSNNLGSSLNVNSIGGQSTNVNTFHGDNISLNTMLGDNTDVSVTVGDTRTFTKQQGKINTSTIQTGDIINTTTQGGAVTTTNTVGGVVTNTNSYLAAVFDTSTYAGAVTSASTHLGIYSNADTKLGLVTSMTTYGGMVTDITNALVARSIIQNGAADNVVKEFASKSESDSSASSIENETSASKVIIREYGAIDKTEVSGGGTRTRSEPGVLATYIGGVVNHINEMTTFL
ncbi:contractile injection system protein, VgrG/Pvc8 family [Herbaspirillum rubrisubalbicans]|nr:contractile injection system protein, VgrG/Pvc8 family [Herbaspirillum rubrisubalbicans]ALU89498.1 Rhs element Vgr protein [Herbaspirillum rubrisubalbicans M1]